MTVIYIREPGGDHQYDSLEFYVGTGTGGSNQWRVSATGVFSGQAAPGRACMDPDHGNRIYRGDENTQKNLDLGGGQAYL